MLILRIFLDQKSAQYFLRKTHFKLSIFEFGPLWRGVEPAESSPPAMVAEYTLTVHKGPIYPLPELPSASI
jgi:hypothetical protein